MSIWSDMEERGIGDLIKTEDIHKASLLIKKIGNAEKLSSFYTSDGILFKLNHQQQRSLRWHKCDLVLDDERFKGKAIYRLGVLSTLGDTGERIIRDAIDKVEKEYGYFDGYTCKEEKTDMHKYVSEKNEKMIEEIWYFLDRHGMVLLGWRTLIRYRRAVSAELIKDLYYDSYDFEGKESRVLRAFGTKKEEEIGLYKVTFEWFKKNQNEEIVIKTSTDDGFYAAIGTDVVSTWQKVNDEYVKVYGNWSLFVKPAGEPWGETEIYYFIDLDRQKDNFEKIQRDYYNTLCEEHGCKIGRFEDRKLSVFYWDTFTNHLNQKDLDILRKDEVYRYSYRFKVGIEGYSYDCENYPNHKDPTSFIVVAIVLNDDNSKKNQARFDFIEEKCKTQIESLQCKEVKWRKNKSFSHIEIILDANFRDKADWPRQMEWMYNTMMGLHKIVKPYYSDIRRIK